jgi:hypothetical protein
MNPSRVASKTYGAYISYPAEFDPINAQDHQPGMDLKVLRKTLFTSYYQDPPPPGDSRVHITTRNYFPEVDLLRILDLPAAGPPTMPPTIGDEITDLIQRYYFETDDSITRLWLERQHVPKIPMGPKPQRHGGHSRFHAIQEFTNRVKRQQLRERKDWRQKDIDHFRRLRELTTRNDTYIQPSLWDGGSHLAGVQKGLERDTGGTRPSKPSLDHVHFAIARLQWQVSYRSSQFWKQGAVFGIIVQPRWCHRRSLEYYNSEGRDFPRDPEVGRGRTKTRSFNAAPPYTQAAPSSSAGSNPRVRPKRRGFSEPPHGSFCAAKLPEPGGPFLPGKLMVLFPRLPVSELDRRSRRRSLSRSHIADMFDSDYNYLLVPDPKEQAQQEETPSGADAAPTPPTQREVPDRQHVSAPPAPEPKPTCANCASPEHGLKECLEPCGYCGAPNPNCFETSFETRPPLSGSQQLLIDHHRKTGLPLNIYLERAVLNILTGEMIMRNGNNAVDDDFEDPRNPCEVYGAGKHGNPHTADACPVPWQSRCKCVPFPQYHVAARCRVRCSRDCGNGHPRGGNKHRNAMTCRSRCCMCGIRGHSGKECRLRKCRCGGHHLGQDCTFKVECAVKGCDRFLCGVHCRSCGGTQKPFVEWRCATCRGEGGDVPGLGGEDSLQGAGKAKRRRAAKKG